MRTCWGNFRSTWLASGGYEDAVVEAMFSTNVAAYFMEWDSELARRIDEAAKYVPLERLCLSPQCGFASTHHGNRLTEDEQWRKLARVVEVARLVWGA
jgi:5-methyltetrahydropteroyltriglutamate--homocysteine methyltransferase